jgi:phenylacetate-CoA ligase
MNYLKYSNLAFENINIIKNIQNQIFCKHLNYSIENSPFYKNKFKNLNLKNFTLSDISSLPLTSKKDLELFTDSFLACTKNQIADIVHTSGTSGKKIFFKYSDLDLKRLAYNEQSALNSILKPSDTVLLTCTMDRCFIAGLAYYSGCRALGCTIIRNGASTFRSSMNLIDELKPNVIIGVPSYIYKLGKFMENQNISQSKNSIKKLICIGEPIREWQEDHKTTTLSANSICKKIESIWQAKVYSTYALTETVTTFCECNAGQGGHLIPELAYVEIINEKGQILPHGEDGEVVITPFFTHAMPLIRYQTGDIARIIDTPCTCGRKSLRLGPITGRKFQMLKVKGTKIYPNSIYPILDSVENVNLYRLIAEKNNISDKLTIELSLKDNSTNAIEQISDLLHAYLRIRIKLIIVDNSKLKSQIFPPGTRKPLKYIEKF